jgi:hypothetical protein
MNTSLSSLVDEAQALCICIRFIQRGFPLASVQTSSETHPASYPTATVGKARPERDADHSPVSSAEDQNE